MKRIHASIIATFAIALATFTSCKKDEPTDIPPQQATWSKFLLMSEPVANANKCEPAMGFCLTAAVSPDYNQPPATGTDELVAVPNLGSDGRLVFEATVNASQLSPETKSQLLDRGFIQFKHDSFFDIEVVRAAYQNAGVPYDNSSIPIEAGVYDASRIDRYDAAGRLITIEICLNGNTWSICITIEF